MKDCLMSDSAATPEWEQKLAEFDERLRRLQKSEAAGPLQEAPHPQQVPAASASPLGFAYSSWAEFALSVGTAAAALGCIIAAIWGVVSLLHGDPYGLVVSFLGFFLQMAMVVVFMRVRDIKPKA
jgi:hypothetical protein